MTKRTALLVNCILLIGCLLFLFLKPRIAGPIGFEVGTQGEITALLETAQEVQEPFFTELAFSGEKLVYDKNTSTFYLPLNMEEEAWETGKLHSLNPQVSLLFEEKFTKTDKQTAMREGKAFRFYAVRGAEYQECFLVATGLPIVAIETTETADTGAFGGMVYFWDSDSKREWTSSNILEAYIRGNTSRTYPKKGYKLYLKKQDKNGAVVEDKKSLFGLRWDDEWILNAMYSDSSKIRDKLSIDVWNAFGAYQPEFPDANFGTDFTYVEVFFNNEYWGLYGLMEPVDSRQLDLEKGGSVQEEEFSYKSVTPQDIPTESLTEEPIVEGSLAGFELKGTLDVQNRDNWKQLLSYLELRDLTDDETFAKEAPVMTDQEGALDVWVYLQAVLGIDNRGKNMYYVSKNVGNSQKIYFAPWDMDITWGDALSVGTDGNIWDVNVNSNLYSERINWAFGDRLVELDVNGSREYVAKIWKKLREGILSEESLTEAVDALVHQVQDSGAYVRNEQRWPESNSGTDYEQFKRMALYRFGILDYFFDGNLDEYMGLGYQ